MSPKSCFIKSIAVLVVVSVAGFGAASLVTLHYHILHNGLVVAHSHPLRSNHQRNTHNHSEQEYAELDAISQLLETVVLPSVLHAFLDLDCLSGFLIDPSFVPTSVTAWYILQRGPPFVSVFS